MALRYPIAAISTDNNYTALNGRKVSSTNIYSLYYYFE